MSRSFKDAPSKTRRRLFAAIAATALGATLLGSAAPAASAATPIVTNGDFETGTLAGWAQADQTGSNVAEWIAYSRETAEGFAGIIPLPPSGEYAALTPNFLATPDTTYLYQDVVLPPASSDQLSMYLFYKSAEPIAVPTPDTLVVSEAETAQPNQQVRVDVLKPNAPIESVSPNDILATVYASRAGDPAELPPTVIGADLSAFAGQTVRLRIADAVQDGAMVAGVDGVSVTSLPLPQPQPVAAPAGPPTSSPSNAFVRGRLTLDQRTGTASLVVSVPDAGVLTASDARRQLAIASLDRRHGGNPKPILIRTATVDAADAGTITVPIRPTPAGRKLLKERGKITFKVELTFTPDGGSAASQPYAGRLREQLRPAPR
jgi:hypothetical protein